MDTDDRKKLNNLKIVENIYLISKNGHIEELKIFMKMVGMKNVVKMHQRIIV